MMKMIILIIMKITILIKKIIILIMKLDDTG